MSGESETPRTLTERAADAAMDTAKATLGAEGASVVHILVVVRAAGIVGEPDCTVAGQGYEDGGELLSELLGQARGVASEIGVDLRIVPVPVGGQG